MIGNPEYVILLVNPEDSMIAVAASTKDDPLSHRLKEGSDGTYEIYSMSFIKNLTSVSRAFAPDSSYRLYGKTDQDKCMVYFSMEEAVPVDGFSENGDVV